MEDWEPRDIDEAKRMLLVQQRDLWSLRWGCRIISAACLLGWGAAFYLYSLMQ